MTGRAVTSGAARGAVALRLTPLARLVEAWSLRVYGPLVLGCLGVAWVVSVAWWLLLPDARTVDLTIPAGTAAAVARGEAVEVIPASLALRRGDTLVVRNQDDALHRLGSEWFPPGMTVRATVSGAMLEAPDLLCSFHPAGRLGVSTLARPGIEHTAVPTLLAGLPLALMAVVGVAVARRLEEAGSAEAG